MSSFKEKERFKEQQEQFQAILSALLKDEDNKYCVDCDAKGPRWASWNIGIFLCIRCAGIHRNLGVHISRVKSVNLDTWTPEQIAMMQEMGNSRGRAVYEANIPDGFRRPQTDSSLEAFIRSKYEQKKYIAREWIPPQPKIPKELVAERWLDDPKSDKKKAKAKPVTTPLQLTNVPKLTSKANDSTPPGDFAKPTQGPKPEVKVPTRTETVSHSASNDLLGLDLGSHHTNAHQAAAPPPSSGNNELLDLFGGPQMSQPVTDNVPATSSSSDLMNGASDGNLFGEDKSAGAGGSVKTSAKDSIMALYGGAGTTSQPQMYGVPGGVYMQQNQPVYPGMIPQQQSMMGMQGIRQQGMMVQPQGMGMMGQPQGMMGQPQGMMGNPAMNPQQVAMYNSSILGANAAMYSPQQMQQLQFQQMQQQMTSLKLGGSQMGAVPQQTAGAGGWGQPGPGQTLSTNLWQ
ncbi:unnamed protein product [Candidula unifasciata]|uniref:Arf-GAP domain-containing protein n=1 Tax=Candidula unifasciata TaxID=100452 RepID=A0A8S3ZW02_9EUPU|nr:unnamed protein product [Candidula unifasciata]